VATAHPHATSAAVRILEEGGSAADAAVAAQAVLCVVLPDSCGLGGDGLTIVRDPGGHAYSYHGAGAAGAVVSSGPATPGATVTVPGVVAAWERLLEDHGRLSLERVLQPAIALAADGFLLTERLRSSIDAQSHRLERGGGSSWAMLRASVGERVVQTSLAELLLSITRDGAAAYYLGRLAMAITQAVAAAGGHLSLDDLQAHRTTVGVTIDLPWRGMKIRAMPPPSQAILLLLALSWLDLLEPLEEQDLDHAMVEVVGEVFELRDRVMEGEDLFHVVPALDPSRVARRSRARDYLHTAGAAVADEQGMVISSLVSLFDDFGSGVFVPDGGFVLNNRGEGFTEPPNDPRPGELPVHTLSPVVVEGGEGPVALATPGADGQVQTLFQVLVGVGIGGVDLPEAIGRPRWRSALGRLFVEGEHRAYQHLADRGHDISVLPDGDARFGAVVAAGTSRGAPFSVADHRRQVKAGAI
jgi:gamma-glutamyltranspeptidase/glutathione hydrolase